MKLAWILGWAVPQAWFRAIVERVLPRQDHRLIPAHPDWQAQLQAAGPCDWTIGYSLGSHLLLNQPPKGQVALLAPIFAFCAEEGLGGTTARAQVRRLDTWVKSDCVSATQDFYHRAGLDIAGGQAGAPDSLSWGLGQLMRGRCPGPMPPGWVAWAGRDDPFFDQAQFAALEPRIRLLPGVGHHPAPLVGAFAETL